MSDKAQPNSIEPYRDAKELTDFAQNVDLADSALSPEAHAARFIRIEAVGATPTIGLEFEGNRNVTRVFTAAAGWEMRGQIRRIVAASTSNVIRVTVAW